MNGYGSQRRLTAATFSVIQTTTMIVWTARKRPVPRNRAIPSANWPTASGLSRRKPDRLRVRPRGTSSRWVSATTRPLAPVVGQQVVEHVVDADGAHQPALRVDHRGRDEVVGGEVAGDLGQRRLRPEGVEVVEDAAHQTGRWFAEQPLDVREAQIAAGGSGRRWPAHVHLTGQGRRQLGL